ncbi:MAG: hypothetical protein C0467_11795 [Planctomycetaceae bacterium]|nr:hypothetical protein [Planctomycetaceae bacterium]
MSAFTSAVAEFIDAARGDKAWVEELNEHGQKFAKLLPRATPTEVNDALRQFASLFPNLRPVASGQVSISCGSLVERGGDPEIVGPALLDLLPVLLHGVADFYRLCESRAAADPEIAAEITLRAQENEEYDLEQYIADESWQALGQRFGPFIFKHAPIPVLAHMAEEFYTLGVIAHLSRSKKLRALARSRPQLLELSFSVDMAARHGSFLTDMLRVLDDERLVVLHPGERKGFEVRISGIADNFQLHTLLAGTLIGNVKKGWLPGTKPDPKVVAQAHDAEITERLHTSGAFNLWNWPGLQPDGTLPTGQTGSDFWIWNEGNPGDILPFEGVRVVLLSPPPYSRSWNAGRRFPNMPGEFVVERTLTSEEVHDWLTRIAAAPKPQAATANSNELLGSP